LPNRRHFEKHFTRQAAQECYKSGQSKIAVLFVDLDNFKYINDSYGHNIGDMVLIEIAHILKTNLRKDDLVIRSGGDEFWLMISNVRSESDTLSVLEKIRERLKQPLYIEDHTIYIQASIGVSHYPESGKSLHEIIHHADKAMYQAKQEKDGYTRWVLYTAAG
jgi:diguanylate cyclase (GGDEF)-like protein